jgi:hypothetical protein
MADGRRFEISGAGGSEDYAEKASVVFDEAKERARTFREESARIMCAKIR